MLFSEGGRMTAACHWVLPKYERPYMPTDPLEPGSFAAHSTVS